MPLTVNGFHFGNYRVISFANRHKRSFALF